MAVVLPPADANLLELSRVLGYSGEKLHLLVWLKDGRRILYASAALLIVQEVDSAKQTFLMGHTADIIAISAAEPVLSTARVASRWHCVCRPSLPWVSVCEHAPASRSHGECGGTI